MPTVRSSPSGPLVDVGLDPIGPETVLLNPEAVTAEPVAGTTSEALDFIDDTPDRLLVRGLTEWESAEVDAVVHPSVARSPNAAKFWLIANGATKAILDSYNISSTADGGVGVINVVIDTDFATNNYPILATIGSASGTLVVSVTIANQLVGSFSGLCVVEAGSGFDPDNWAFAGFGDLV